MFHSFDPVYAGWLNDFLDQLYDPHAEWERYYQFMPEPPHKRGKVNSRRGVTKKVKGQRGRSRNR